MFVLHWGTCSFFNEALFALYWVTCLSFTEARSHSSVRHCLLSSVSHVCSLLRHNCLSSTEAHVFSYRGIMFVIHLCICLLSSEVHIHSSQRHYFVLYWYMTFKLCSSLTKAYFILFVLHTGFLWLILLLYLTCFPSSYYSSIAM
jgi:hypothetical protein